MGIRPDKSLTTRGNCPGGTSLIRKFSVSIGFRQDAQRSAPLMGTSTGVTEAT